MFNEWRWQLGRTSYCSEWVANNDEDNDHSVSYFLSTQRMWGNKSGDSVPDPVTATVVLVAAASLL